MTDQPEIRQIARYDTPTRKNSNRFRTYDGDGIAPSLSTMGGGNIEPHVLSKKPSEQKEPVNNTQPKRIGGVGSRNFGNQFRQGNRIYDANEIAIALTAQPTGNAGGHTSLYATEQIGIRKLTPLECWRLMGMTDEDYDQAEQVNSNTQLYKQAGNAIVVNVLESLFENITGEGEQVCE